MKIVSQLALSLAIAYTFAKPTFAQNCDATLFAHRGAQVEITEYDANKNEKSTKVLTVNNVQSAGQILTTKVRSVKAEQNGTVSEDKTLTYRCTKDGVEYGTGIEDPKTKQEYFLRYPSEMAPGMTIKPDLQYEVSQTGADGKKAKLTVKITDRKAGQKESISVKAGTWECTKLTYNFSMKIKVGLLSLPIDAKVTEWYSPEVGVVRSETWIRGKMESYSEITSIDK